MRLQTRWLTLGIVSLACAALAGLAEAASPSPMTVSLLATSAAGVTTPVRAHARKPKPATGTSVASTPVSDALALPAPPSNDACAGAITIPCGNISLSGNSFMAVNDYDFSDTTTNCTGYYAGGKDVVYRIDALAGDYVWLRYKSTADAVLYIVTDCAHVQDSCKAGADEFHQGQLETLNYVFVRTGTYYVILDSYGQDTYGNWTLVGQYVACGLNPPVNDRCETATSLFCNGFLYSGSTLTAFNDYSFSSIGASCVNSLAGGRDVVFSLSVTAGDSLSVNYTSTADGVMYLMPNCTPTGGPVSCVAGSNSAGVGGTETINFVFTYTGTYYLVLDEDGNDTDGSWTLSGALVCGLAPPTNDICETAAYLPCGTFSLSGDNSLALPDYDAGSGTCTGFQSLGPDVVYRIDAAPGDSIWCDYVFPHVPTRDDVDASIYLVLSDCSRIDSLCVAGSDTVGDAQVERLRYKFTTRGTYYMILDSYATTISGNWTALGDFICPMALGVGTRPATGPRGLSAAFPNPFEISSTLRFAVPGRARGALRVHDLAGRVVRTLIDGELSPGEQSITWDARDDHGLRVPGGTYFARLMLGDRVSYRTLILVR